MRRSRSPVGRRMLRGSGSRCHLASYLGATSETAKSGLSDRAVCEQYNDANRYELLAGSAMRRSRSPVGRRMLRGAFPYSKMPRLGRIVLPNYPHHVVQRGHNKQAVFAEEADYLYYLNTLEEFKDLYDIKVYGFC
jgi:hypothetical protein